MAHKQLLAEQPPACVQVPVVDGGLQCDHDALFISASPHLHSLRIFVSLASCMASSFLSSMVHVSGRVSESVGQAALSCQPPDLLENATQTRLFIQSLWEEEMQREQEMIWRKSQGV